MSSGPWKRQNWNNSKGFCQDIRKIKGEILAIEIIRNDGMNPVFSGMGAYKAIVRTAHDQFVIYPKQHVEFNGSMVVIEDLVIGWVTQTIHSKEVAPSIPKTEESTMDDEEE